MNKTPSVTQICCMHIDKKWIPAASATRGTAVHSWANNYLKKIWDPFSQDEYPEYIEGLKSWIDDNKAEISFGETRLFHKKLNYSGKPDFIGTIESEEGFGLIDFKTGQARQPWWKLQIAGYCDLVSFDLCGLSKWPHEIQWCGSVRIDKEGKVSFDKYDLLEIGTKYLDKFYNVKKLYCSSLETGNNKKKLDSFTIAYNNALKNEKNSKKVIANYIRYDVDNKKSLFYKEK